MLRRLVARIAGPPEGSKLPDRNAPPPEGALLAGASPAQLAAIEAGLIAAGLAAALVEASAAEARTRAADAIFSLTARVAPLRITRALCTSCGCRPQIAGLTWEEALRQARAAPGTTRLPTCVELERARASDVVKRRDVWFPVRRLDRIERDWCGPNNERPASYNSHLDRHRGIPGWGADGGGHGHIPGLHGSQLPWFFVAASEVDVYGAAAATARLPPGVHLSRPLLLALGRSGGDGDTGGGGPLTAEQAITRAVEYDEAGTQLPALMRAAVGSALARRGLGELLVGRYRDAPRELAAEACDLIRA